MILPLPRYRQVKDKYCVCYFGHCEEYITTLLAYRPIVEAELTGLQLYIGCRDDLYGPERTVPETAIRQMTREPWGTGFGHIRELRFNQHEHPIERFFADSKIDIRPISRHQPEEENRIVGLYPNGSDPTRSLTSSEITSLTLRYEKAGKVVRVNGPWQEAGVVVGVENKALFEAAAAGKTISLCDTGIGRGFLCAIAPWAEVISL